MRAGRALRSVALDVVALAVAGIIFVVPFIFIVLTAGKDKVDASSLNFSLPIHWQLLDNIEAVIAARNDVMITALINSMILTVGSVLLIVILSALIAYVLQRRRDRSSRIVATFVLAGLIIPAVRRADHLHVPDVAHLQDAVRPDPGRGGVHDALLRAGDDSVHGRHSRARSTKRR